MGDSLPATLNETVKSVLTNTVLGLDEYESDEALAAVELFTDYPEALLKFASVCCGLFMVLGIPGNLITIVALARCKKVRNATAIFIINLSCADLLFGAFNLPLAASTFWQRSWTHGRLMCKIFPLARYALVAISLFTVLAITINRYILIARPSLYSKLYKKKYLAMMIATLWIVSFATLIATWLDQWGEFSLDPSIGSCSIVADKYGRSPKKFLFIAAFLVPGFAIIAFYARIFWIVKKVAKRSRPALKMKPKSEILSRQSELSSTTSSPENRVSHICPPSNRINNSAFNCLAIPDISSSSGTETAGGDEKRITDGDRFMSRSNEALQKLRIAFTPAPREQKCQKMPSRKDRKLRTMIMAIMLSFCFCHLPITMTKVFLEFSHHPFVNIASYVLLYLTTCINPIIYVVMSNEYRQAYKNLIMCQKSEQDFHDSTVLKRIVSMKPISSVRRSIRQLNLVNKPTPT